jgi:3-deoxy-D-manno-octulosonic-acid transferase
VGGLEERTVLIAASTQPAEEEFVLTACDSLWELDKRLLLLIAPRRPERFELVADVVARTGLRYERRSTMRDRVASETKVLLLDTVGELLHLLPAASAVFVGGTVAPLGGHNVLEPAAYGKPVAFGPNTANVAGAAEELCREGGAVTVRTPQDLERLWKRLLMEAERVAEMGARARSVADAHANAVERTWEIVGPYLESGRRRAEASPAGNTQD